MIQSLIAAIVLAGSGLAAADMPPVLSSDGNGGLRKDGKPFRAIGVNYFSCFYRTLLDGEDKSYEKGFEVLAREGIPFVRFAATGFWPKDMALYRSDREEYFRRLDAVVAAAEKHGIGLIPSLFWYYACVPDLVGEPMDQWGNPESKVHAWMREYVPKALTAKRTTLPEALRALPLALPAAGRIRTLLDEHIGENARAVVGLPGFDACLALLRTGRYASALPDVAVAAPETKSYLRLPLDTVGIKGRTYSLIWSKRSAENRFWVAKAVELFASLFRFG